METKTIGDHGLHEDSASSAETTKCITKPLVGFWTTTVSQNSCLFEMGHFPKDRQKFSSYLLSFRRRGKVFSILTIHASLSICYITFVVFSLFRNLGKQVLTLKITNVMCHIEREPCTTIASSQMDWICQQYGLRYGLVSYPSHPGSRDWNDRPSG